MYKLKISITKITSVIRVPSSAGLVASGTFIAKPKSAKAHVPSCLTKMFLLLKSRCANAGLDPEKKNRILFQSMAKTLGHNTGFPWMSGNGQMTYPI